MSVVSWLSEHDFRYVAGNKLAVRSLLFTGTAFLKAFLSTVLRHGTYEIHKKITSAYERAHIFIPISGITILDF